MGGEKAGVALSELHGKRVAVILVLPTGVRVFRGVGAYERDEEMGNLLRVQLEQGADTAGCPEFLFHEESWQGEIARDEQHGCDYALTVEAMQGCSALS